MFQNTSLQESAILIAELLANPALIFAGLFITINIAFMAAKQAMGEDNGIDMPKIGGYLLIIVFLTNYSVLTREFLNLIDTMVDTFEFKIEDRLVTDILNGNGNGYSQGMVNKNERVSGKMFLMALSMAEEQAYSFTTTGYFSGKKVNASNKVEQVDQSNQDKINNVNNGSTGGNVFVQAYDYASEATEKALAMADVAMNGLVNLPTLILNTFVNFLAVTIFSFIRYIVEFLVYLFVAVLVAKVFLYFRDLG